MKGPVTLCLLVSALCFVLATTNETGNHRNVRQAVGGNTPNQPNQPGTQPGTPGAQPVPPGTQPGTPGAQPIPPEPQPGTPGAQPVPPGTQPGTPGAQPVPPEPQPGTPGAQPVPPGAQPVPPGTQPGTPGTWPGTPGAQPVPPGTGPGTPGTWPGTPGAQPVPPGTGPGTPGTWPGTPGAQPVPPGTGPGTPGTWPGTPGAQPVPPGTRPGTPGTRPGTPGTWPGTPGAGTPGVGPGPVNPRLPKDPPAVPQPPRNAPKIPGLPSAGDTLDTRGTEFIFCFTSNQGNRLPLGLTLLIGAGGPNDTNVIVMIPKLKYSRQFVIRQGLTEVVELPPEAMAIGNGEQNGTIWIRATLPVTVHGINKQIKSNEGFLALPVNGLGLEYFVASYMASGAERSELMITAVMDFTRLRIKPIQRVMYNNKWFNPGQTILITMNRFQSIQIQSLGDLTGTKIIADRPISVITGSTCSLVTEQMQKCDHLVENLPPVATWGKKFSMLPLRNRTTGYVYRVIAARPNTRFTVLGQLFILAREGLFREFNQPMPIALSIASDKPIMVVQYAKGGSLDRVGDPFMVVIPPIEQYIAGSVTFNTFDLSGPDQFISFASVSVTSWDLFNIYLNNDPLLSHSYKASQEQQDFTRVVNFAADYWLPLTPGSHSITGPAPGSRFVAMIYGWSAGTSYAFPAVYGLRRLLCTPSNTAESFHETAEKDCTGPIVSGIIVSEKHGTGVGIQPPPVEPGVGGTPGWGKFKPDGKHGAEKGSEGPIGGGNAGVFFPWYTVPPWQAEIWEDILEDQDQVCYSISLIVLSAIAPACVVFFGMLIIICAMLFRRQGNGKF